jgi:hypothetical protein
MEGLDTYYERRAAEYDAIYDKPERQDDLEELKVRLRELFAGRTVLEIAAGTGCWTQHIARWPLGSLRQTSTPGRSPSRRSGTTNRGG